MQSLIAISEIVRNFALVLGGLIGLVFAGYRVRAANRQAEAQIRQAELARQDHVSELFNRAVSQLKDEKLEVRFGAILTLGRIRRDFPDRADEVVQLLTTFLRANAVDYGNDEPPADVRGITNILRDLKEGGP